MLLLKGLGLLLVEAVEDFLVEEFLLLMLLLKGFVVNRRGFLFDYG